ncbi:hypothetical protein [Thioclava sp. SK-1]|uniref:hypothetical protein n=1 Tax=Thioclava sp. SK-1 TaxID=1889770 RepID=UPI00159F173E|nr:hypothetical protein [Thioclava sp. SK-1]
MAQKLRLTALLALFQGGQNDRVERRLIAMSLRNSPRARRRSVSPFREVMPRSA